MTMIPSNGLTQIQEYNKSLSTILVYVKLKSHSHKLFSLDHILYLGALEISTRQGY